MTSVFVKIALATALAAATAIALIGLSGMIIFADLNAPQPTALARDALSGSTAPAALTGAGR
jgi:hypothetical protein